MILKILKLYIYVTSENKIIKANGQDGCEVGKVL